MNAYTLVLFAHVVSAIGYCIGIATLLLVLVGLRRARRVEQVRALMQLNDVSAPVGGMSALLLAAGLYLALTEWSLLTSWILVALISVIVMVPTSAVLIAPRRRALAEQLARETSEGGISAALTRRIHDPVLFAVVQTVAALLLGLIFLMTTKPDLVGSVVVMVVALALSLASSALTMRAGQIQRVGGERPTRTIPARRSASGER
jgi:uncharacterized membrane protein